MSEACELSATEARRRIGDKSLSPVDLLESCIARIEAVNPTVNAVVAKGYERARVEAKAAEDAVMRGDDLGVLHGLPLAVKDLNDTEGLLTTYGSLLFKDHVPDKDENLIANLRKSGAIVFCKTNTPEFGAGANTTNKVWGSTGNPFDPARICGGSSGGSAVALATNMTPIATGSDTGGSLRIPAAICGVVAHRSTPGLVPVEKRKFGYSTFGVQGPMARNVDDAALMLSTMARFDRADPLSSPMRQNLFKGVPEVDLSKLKVAVSSDLGFAIVDKRIRATFEDRVGLFKSAFRECVWREPDLSTVRKTNWVLRALQYLARYKELYETRGDELGDNVKNNYEAGQKLSAADIAWATAEQTNLYREMQCFFEDVDILICPTVAVPPFPVEQLYCDEIDGQKLDDYVEWMSLTWGLTIPGNPVTNVPCGLEPTGTPFGLQICGRHHDDRFILGVAKSLERVFAGDPRTARPTPDIAALSA
ncbi:MAG: Asp-tRNA(Asn)/Glu-tRNA(Gln) amidotransferase A subunit family amidase [Alphaproteobacteria bacterium]|jgi:amidase